MPMLISGASVVMVGSWAGRGRKCCASCHRGVWWDWSGRRDSNPGRFSSGEPTSGGHHAATEGSWQLIRRRLALTSWKAVALNTNDDPQNDVVVDRRDAGFSSLAH